MKQWCTDDGEDNRGRRRRDRVLDANCSSTVDRYIQSVYSLGGNSTRVKVCLLCTHFPQLLVKEEEEADDKKTSTDWSLRRQRDKENLVSSSSAEKDLSEMWDWFEMRKKLHWPAKNNDDDTALADKMSWNQSAGLLKTTGKLAHVSSTANAWSRRLLGKKKKKNTQNSTGQHNTHHLTKEVSLKTVKKSNWAREQGLLQTGLPRKGDKTSAKVSAGEKQSKDFFMANAVLGKSLCTEKR